MRKINSKIFQGLMYNNTVKTSIDKSLVEMPKINGRNMPTCMPMRLFFKIYIVKCTHFSVRERALTSYWSQSRLFVFMLKWCQFAAF